MIESALILALTYVPNDNHVNSSEFIAQEKTILRETQEVFINPLNFLAQVLPLASNSGFNFELVDCSRMQGSSEPYICNFLIENTHSSEKELALYARSSGPWVSRIIDNQGYEINAVSARLGSSYGEGSAKAWISPGAPIRASVSFESIPEGGIRLIDLDCFLFGPGGHSFNVQFTQS